MGRRVHPQKRSMSWVNSVLRQFLTNGPSSHVSPVLIPFLIVPVLLVEPFFPWEFVGKIRIPLQSSHQQCLSNDFLTVPSHSLPVFPPKKENGGKKGRNGHKSLRTLMKRSSLWELPGVNFLLSLPNTPFLFQDKEGILGLKRRWKRKSSVTAGKTWLTVDSFSNACYRRTFLPLGISAGTGRKTLRKD